MDLETPKGKLNNWLKALLFLLKISWNQLSPKVEPRACLRQAGNSFWLKT